jgi:dTDP-4-dehydrorhamnose reductase
MALAWITGANGLIGSQLVHAAPRFGANWKVRGLERNDFELTDFAAVQRAFDEDKPRLLIHCAALSKTPACEADPSLARKLNVDVTAQLASLAAEIPFVFFSTDLVFDGRAGNYDEAAAVNPLSVYAETKVAAEEIVRRRPHHLIIRTSLNGGASPTGDRGFNEEMRRAWQSGETLKLFTDEFRSPISATVTARAVWELISKNASGTFHVAGSERLSRFQIGELLSTRWQRLHPKFEPASLKEYQGPPRAPDTSLNCAKARNLLSFPLPGLADWLKTNPAEVF